MKSLSSAKITFVCFLISGFLVFYAFYLEHSLGLEPCLLCIMQRIILTILCALFLIAAIHRPQARGVRIYGGLTFLISILGMLAAFRQVWLQNQPSQPGQLCMPGFENSLANHHSSFIETLKVMIKGSSDCGQVLWKFLGLSMAEWTFIFFTLFALVSAILIFRKKVL